MKTRILKRIYILFTLGVLFGVLLLCFRATTHSPSIIVGRTHIPVSVADTGPLREQGLSGTEMLSKGTGKLFIFDTSDSYGFWMKDMAYPIDIVWIDADWKVVGVSERATPLSYPTIFYPPTPVRYVLELNAGEAVGDNFSIGTTLRFEK